MFLKYKSHLIIFWYFIWPENSCSTWNFQFQRFSENFPRILREMSRILIESLEKLSLNGKDNSSASFWKDGIFGTAWKWARTWKDFSIYPSIFSIYLDFLFILSIAKVYRSIYLSFYLSIYPIYLNLFIYLFI